MKKLLALFVTSLILLTSMSDCKKNIDLNLVGGVEDILISVDINGLPYETTELKINPMYLPTDYKLKYIKYTETADSVGYELCDDPDYCGKEDAKDALDLYFSIRISLRGQLSFGEWYELDLNNSTFLVHRDVGKSMYKITKGMMKITDPETEFGYYGEFWFNAVNKEDENDVIVAKNGRFEKLRLGRW